MSFHKPKNLPPETEVLKNYPVMFSQPGTDEAGTPEGISLLKQILKCEVHEDGYSYASFGPKTRENLQKLVDNLESIPVLLK